MRAAAARAVAGVLNGASLDDTLAAERPSLSAADAALLQQIAYGVLRDWRLLQHFAQQLTHTPPRPALLAVLLAVGIYQLRSLRLPAYAAVSSTVAATTELDLRGARGLVNAVLRRYQREQPELEATLPESPALRYSHPDWLVEQLRLDWPQQWPRILADNNTPAPMWLRVNTARISRDAYLEQLHAAGLDAETSPHATAALRLSAPVNVTELPGFGEGKVSVQDAAAQLAVPLLADGNLALDACAAPGGKAAQWLEINPAIKLLALDRDAARLQRVRDTFARLGLQAELRCADASTPQNWWDGKNFDGILLDAPCSGTGVIRRHPDIKWLRRARDIASLAERQLDMLRALWPVLKMGGRLLYSVCSTLHAEGEANVARFLQTAPDAEALRIDAAWGEALKYGRRIAPGDGQMDGFYYALIGKRGG